MPQNVDQILDLKAVGIWFIVRQEPKLNQLIG